MDSGGFLFSLCDLEKQSYLALALIPEHQPLGWSEISPPSIETALLPSTETASEKEKAKYGFLGLLKVFDITLLFIDTHQ